MKYDFHLCAVHFFWLILFNAKSVSLEKRNIVFSTYKIDESTSTFGRKRYQSRWSSLTKDIVFYFIEYKTLLLNTITNSSIDISINSFSYVIQGLIHFLLQFTAYYT